MMQCNSEADDDMVIGNSTAFDVWLHEGLSGTFDAVLQDPVPEELLAILTVGP